MIPATTDCAEVDRELLSDPRARRPVLVGAATPMLAAAGIVVTEISTPAKAPDFAVVRDSTPATPAMNATKNEKKSGLEMITAKL